MAVVSNSLGLVTKDHKLVVNKKTIGVSNYCAGWANVANVVNAAAARCGCSILDNRAGIRLQKASTADRLCFLTSQKAAVNIQDAIRIPNEFSKANVTEWRNDIGGWDHGRYR